MKDSSIARTGDGIAAQLANQCSEWLRTDPEYLAAFGRRLRRHRRDGTGPYSNDPAERRPFGPDARRCVATHPRSTAAR